METKPRDRWALRCGPQNWLLYHKGEHIFRRGTDTEAKAWVDEGVWPKESRPIFAPKPKPPTLDFPENPYR